MAILINFKICDNAPECLAPPECPTGAITWNEEKKTLIDEMNKQKEAHIVFDGFPINQQNFEAWNKITHEKLNAIFYLEVSEDEMKKRVMGQDEAIKLVSNAIIRARAGIKDPNKPIGSFIFLGPTGVGKTEVAKTLAYELFDDERHLIRIDMKVDN